MKIRKLRKTKLGKDLKAGDHVVLPEILPCDDYPDGVPEGFAIVYEPENDDLRNGVLGAQVRYLENLEAGDDLDDDEEIPWVQNQEYQMWEEVK